MTPISKSLKAIGFTEKSPQKNVHSLKFVYIVQFRGVIIASCSATRPSKLLTLCSHYGGSRGRSHRGAVFTMEKTCKVMFVASEMAVDVVDIQEATE